MSIVVVAPGFTSIPEHAKKCPQCGWTKAIGMSRGDYPIDPFNPQLRPSLPSQYWRFTCADCQCVWMWDERPRKQSDLPTVGEWTHEPPTEPGPYLFWPDNAPHPYAHDVFINGADDGRLHVSEGITSYRADEWPWNGEGMWLKVQYKPLQRCTND